MKRLAMIPALGCDDGLYDEIAPALARRLALQTVIADADYLQHCVRQVLDAVEGPFIVLGTSFGARVALETTLAAPERVQGLVMIGSAAGPAADPVAGFRRGERLRGGECAQVAQEMGAMVAHLPGPCGPHARARFMAMFNNMEPERIAYQSDALAKRMDLWSRLSEIACPALMLWGKFDQFSPVADGLRMASAITKGRYVELAECGHFPTLEYPDETCAAIVHWLADTRLTSG